ncbi:MAG: cupin domain-containing protein [Myxococcota bacterium]
MLDDITIASIESIAPYSGPHAIEGIRFRPARQALGVTAWGMSVLELDPHCRGYPAHDHGADGQEEVYVVLRGSAVLAVEGAERRLVAGELVRVPPARTRHWRTEDEGVTLLALGATPGQAYDPNRGVA